MTDGFSLIDIVNKSELVEAINLIENNNHGLNEFLLAIYESSNGNFLYDANKKSCLDDINQLPNIHSEDIPFIEKVIEYNVNLIFNYESDKPFNLLSKTLRSIKFLDQEDRLKYINQFNGFIKTDSKCPNDSIMHRVIDDVMGGIVNNYEHKFKELSEKSIKKDNDQYKVLIESLKKDLEKVTEYTLNKLDLNEKYDPQAQKIGYLNCFPENGNGKDSCEEISIDVLNNLFSQHRSDQEYKLFVEKNNLIGVYQGGPKQKDKTFVNLCNGSNENPINNKLIYPKGLNKNEFVCFSRLASQIPIDANTPERIAKGTKKLAQQYKR